MTGVDQYNPRRGVIDVWREGNKGGTHVKCYATNGGSDQCALIWVEDTPLKGELCWIEAYFSYKCSPSRTSTAEWAGTSARLVGRAERRP